MNEIHVDKMFKQLFGNSIAATTVLLHLSSSEHSACYTLQPLLTNKACVAQMSQNSKKYNFKLLNVFTFFRQSKPLLDHGTTQRPLLFCAQPTAHFQLTSIQIIA